MTSGDALRGEGSVGLSVLDDVAAVEPTSPEEAAEVLFENPRAEFEYEPEDDAEARRAVDRFRQLFDAVPGALRAALDGARAGAEMLSGDRLQGLAEIIQNADDTSARRVEFRVVGNTLIATHDGAPVRLPDVLALALPWLSNKTEDASATGRFGIGLMTLRVLSDVLDVHSGPYHVRLGDPTIAPLDGSDHPASVDGMTTVFCIPLEPDSLSSSDIEDWLRRWDDTALLFCRNVKRVTVVNADGDPLHTLSLEWSDQPPASCVIAGTEVPVQRRHAVASDSRSWIVHTTEPAAPSGVSRARKATGTTIPLAVALPLQPEAQGLLYAGLPVVETVVPVRINAQFDPITGRHQLANTPWNDAMLPLIGDLWVETVAALLSESPTLGWAVVPLPPADGSDSPSADATSSVATRLETLLLDRARNDLVDRLTFDVNSVDYPLTSLAVEDERLEGVLTPSEVATLAELDATLPIECRDEDGRWRDVLDDWRSSGAALPPPVTVSQALALLENETRSPAATVALVAAGLDAGLDSRLAALPCVIAAGGDRLMPPAASSLEALVVEASPLAEALGVGLRIDDAFLADTDDAETVMEWLRERGAVIDGADSEVVVRRLAAAGRAGKRLSTALTDEQAVALRDAFEAMNPEDRPPLGREVGKVILLDAYRHDARGKRVAAPAHPAEAYLPRTIDKEPDSFARAADTAPGLTWLHARYAESLRSSLGRAGGLGPQRFLRLLGAEIAPRLIPHPGLQHRFSGSSLGLPAFVTGGPRERQLALTAIGASYTLSDVDSPDLRAVVVSIAKEKRAKRRRERADALLGTLARAWDRLSESAEVTAAEDYYSWQSKGTVRAFWLWSVGATAWLDDTDGTPQPPLDLRLRTPATIAVHGSDAPGYLRPEFNAPNRREVLTALGVTGEPSTRDLVDRLRTLRDDPEEGANVGAEAAVVYQALAERVGRGRHGSIPGDLGARDLRTAFGAGAGLVFTQLGWHPPTNVLSGDPVFGDRRAFVPQIRATERLWTALQIRQPSLDDCLKVIGELARTRAEPVGRDLVVLLDTLRVLVQRVSSADTSSHPNRRLAKVPLWTTQGWTTDRPVYAVDDPLLATGLGLQVPVWMPGGELGQFEPLLAPLRIHRLDTHNATVVDADSAVIDDEATETLRLAVPLLHEDLARNDPATDGSLRIPWSNLESFEVRVDPNLSIRVDGLVGDRAADVPVAATAQASDSALYLVAPSLLRQVDGGGRAIAGLFGADARRVSQAWLAACIAAEEGREAQRMELAAQRAQEEQARNEQDVAEQLAAFRAETAGRHATGRSRRRAGSTRTPAPSGTETPQPRPSPAPRPRVLVDPETLALTDPMGTPGGGGTDGQRTRRRRSTSGAADRPLPEPNRDGASPRGTSPPTSYTQVEKEAVGLELVRMVLAGDAEEIVDLRAQHGVGADAIDELDRFFELKVHGGEEPETIRLEQSEIRRAMSTPNFFLAVVSHVEGVEARPKVRIIVDPVNQLRMVDSSSVSFTGVRSAEHSLVYDFAPLPDEAPEADDSRTAPSFD